MKIILVAFLIALFSTQAAGQAPPDSWSDACNYPDSVDPNLSPQIANLLKAEVMLVNGADITNLHNGYWQLLQGGSFTVDRNGDNLCSDSLFYGQYSSDLMHGKTGFMVGPDKVATAHESSPPGIFVIVAGFNGGLLGAGCSFNQSGLIPDTNVYTYNGGFFEVAPTGDMMVFQLNRPVTGATWLRMRSSGAPSTDDVIAQAGHPYSLFTKFQYGVTYVGPLGTNGNGLDPTLPTFFDYEIAVGNSGSPFYNLTKGVVEQLVESGLTGTYTGELPGDSCTSFVSQYDNPNSNTGFPLPGYNNNGKIASLAGVAETTEPRLAPMQDTTYIADIGGAITPATSSYTLTASAFGGTIPAAISVQPAPAGEPQLLSGAGLPWSGTLLAGHEEDFTLNASAPAGIACGTYDRYLEVDAGGFTDLVRHRFEIGLREYALTPADDWTVNDIGPPYLQSKTYTLKNVRPTPTHVMVSQDGTLPHSNLILINGAATASFNLGAAGSATDTATVVLTIDPTAAAATSAGTTYQGRIAVYNQPFNCSVPSEDWYIYRNVNFKRGEQLFTGSPPGALLPSPTAGQQYGTPVRFDLDLSGEDAGSCVGDIDLYLGIPPGVAGLTVDQAAPYLQIQLTSPSGVARVLWLGNAIPNSAYESVALDAQGDSIPALYLDDQVAPPLGPYQLSAFSHFHMKGHWYMDVSSSHQGNLIVAPAQLDFTKAALCTGP